MLALALVCLILVTSLEAKSVKASEWPVRWNDISVKAPNPWAQTLQVNLRDTTNYTLTHSSDVPIQVCFQETYAVPVNPFFWKESCTFYSSFATSGDRTIALRQSVYSVGIYFDGVVPAGKQTTVSLHVGNNAGNEICPDQTVWGSTSCQAPVALVAGKNSVNFTANIPQVFSFVVPQDPILTGSVSVAGQGLVLNFRRAGASSSLHADASGSGNAQLSAPRPGTYYALVTSATTQTTDLVLTLEDCTHSKLHGSGVGCALFYNHNDDDEDIIGVVGQYYFWQVVITPDDPLHVSVAVNGGGSPNPRLLASRGNVPTLGNADFSGCNVADCGYANIIHYSPKSNETWYVSVTPQPTANGTDYGIWWNEDCAPSCENNGECIEEGTNTGKCQCTDPANTGVGCQVSASLSKQYVALAAIWGTALGLTVFVLLAQFFTSNKETYERLA